MLTGLEVKIERTFMLTKYSDIESYNYGYNAKILELEEGVNTINYCIDKLITKNIKLEQERFRQNDEIAKLWDMV